ncbi:type II toxin-antitoxin system VapB family antitoxin [Rickettsiales bacterium LUAb2]
MLRTNIELDEKLVDEAIKLSNKKTKKEVVNYALVELINKLKRQKILELQGKVNWEGNLDDMRQSRV